MKHLKKKNYIKQTDFQNNVQFSALVSRRLSHHKTVVSDYSFVFLKTIKTIVINHDFNFKFKIVIVNYNFDYF